MAVSEKMDKSMICRKAKQMQCVMNYRMSTIEMHIHTQIIKMTLERKGCDWVLARQDTILFVVCELFTLTIRSISLLKNLRLIKLGPFLRTAKNSAVF